MSLSMIGIDIRCPPSFAPGAADTTQADGAGRQAVAYSTALRARHSWWRRLWWSVHPGPLRWRR